MTTEYDQLLNAVCFLLSLLYLALQCGRLMKPLWAMRFEGKLSELQRLMAQSGLHFTEKELRCAVPAEAAINGLLFRAMTDARELDCRRAFRRALALFAAAIVLTAGLGLFYAGVPLAASYASDLVLLALATVIAACARYRVLRILYFVAEKMDEAQGASPLRPLER